MSIHASAKLSAPTTRGRSGSTAATAARPGRQLKWGAGTMSVVLVVALMSTIGPGLATMTLVAAASFLAGLAVPRPQAPGALRRKDAKKQSPPTTGKLDTGSICTSSDIESLKRRLADLESEVRSIALTGFCIDDNRIAACGFGLNVTAHGPETEVKWAQSSSRMRERVLFLWGEMALQYFGVDEEMYWPQLARSADSETFLQRNKWFLENILNYNVPAQEKF